MGAVDPEFSRFQRPKCRLSFPVASSFLPSCLRHFALHSCTLKKGVGPYSDEQKDSVLAPGLLMKLFSNLNPGETGRHSYRSTVKSLVLKAAGFPGHDRGRVDSDNP